MAQPFPDRRTELFGREAAIEELVRRASSPGLTALVARPLMGKTWTLEEVARRLQEDGRYLVGRHEYSGGELNHFLHAVADLYERWLSNATLRKQAAAFWEKHKRDWVVRIGGAFGTLFGGLGKTILPEGVSDLVREAFAGLVATQRGFSSGDLELPRLPYEQALSLIQMLEKVSGCRTILILDAWEQGWGQGQPIRHEMSILQAFLKRLDKWPPLHIFLAIRHPDSVSTREADEAFQAISNLCSLYPAALCRELEPMALGGSQESTRMLAFVRERVDGANQADDERLLELIGAYPGVINRWRQLCPDTYADLQAQADDAQTGRYPELDGLLSSLPDPVLELAASIALLPRMDDERWDAYREILLSDRKYLETLIDGRVLADEPVPTYGHDTRHGAARNWFINKRQPLLRRVTEQCIAALAARVTGVNRTSLPYFSGVVSAGKTALEIGVSDSTICLIDASCVPFGQAEAASYQEFADLCQQAVEGNALLAPLFTVALIDRGLFRDGRGDEGAIADFTAAINLPNAPCHEVAWALLLRGSTLSERKDEERLRDYSAVITLQNVPVERAAEARIFRARINHERAHRDEAIADYTTVIELPNVSTIAVGVALVERGVVKGELGDVAGELADYTATIELPGASGYAVARALLQRGSKQRTGDVAAEIADYTRASEVAEAPVHLVAQALLVRGAVRYTNGDIDGALLDYDKVIELPDVPVNVLTRALFLRASHRSAEGNDLDAIRDFTAVIDLSGASVDYVADALLHRGIIYTHLRKYDAAISDYSALLELPDAPANLVKNAKKWLLTLALERNDAADP